MDTLRCVVVPSSRPGLPIRGKRHVNVTAVLVDGIHRIDGRRHANGETAATVAAPEIEAPS
jgi:hypothetical protein